ncbi:MAG TPA: MFS transporter [Hyphomonadaceae bacterium]|nr:MFS transporter [Hyphomonadaceae bacterium]
MTDATADSASAPPQAAPPSARAFNPGYVRYAMVLLLIVYTLNFVDRQIVSILNEDIKEALGASDTQMGLLGGLAFALFYTTLGIPIAVLADRGNRVKIIATGLAIWSAMTAVCGLATNFLQIFLARIGVGVGEAACTPPAQSLIADYVPAERRASAMAFYALGIPLGTMLGFAFGGIFAQAFGWRAALLLAGGPGVILAVIVWLTLKEPRLHLPKRAHGPPASRPSVGDYLKLFANPTYVHLCCAGGVAAFVGYGLSYWLPAYFIRAFQMSVLEVGLVFGVALGFTGMIGTMLGGLIVDHFKKRFPGAIMAVPATALLVASPAFILALTAPTKWTAIAFLAAPLMLNSFWYGPAFAAVQSLVAPSQRATATAIYLFVVNLIGLGGGIPFVGWLSDHLGQIAQAGDIPLGMNTAVAALPLRWSIVIVGTLGLWATVHMFLAARTMRRDVVS